MCKRRGVVWKKFETCLLRLQQSRGTAIGIVSNITVLTGIFTHLYILSTFCLIYLLYITKPCSGKFFLEILRNRLSLTWGWPEVLSKDSLIWTLDSDYPIPPLPPSAKPCHLPQTVLLSTTNRICRPIWHKFQQQGEKSYTVNSTHTVHSTQYTHLAGSFWVLQ